MVAIPLLRWVLKTDSDVMWPGCLQKGKKIFMLVGSATSLIAILRKQNCSVPTNLLPNLFFVQSFFFRTCYSLHVLLWQTTLDTKNNKTTTTAIIHAYRAWAGIGLLPSWPKRSQQSCHQSLRRPTRAAASSRDDRNSISFGNFPEDTKDW